MVMSRMARSRAPGAVPRAWSVALLVALPQLLLGHGAGGTPQLVTLVALLAGLFVFAEYAARAPTLLEFRDARPYNRLRAGFVAVALLVVSAMLRPDWQAAAAAAPLRWLAAAAAEVLGQRWSPVHGLLATLPDGADPALREDLRRAAAVAYALSLLMVAAFALAIRLRGWPNRGSFNVWVNLPQFDPRLGGDVVGRLQQNAVVNVALGFLLPFIVPIAADVLALAFEGASLANPAALVWVVIGWAFIPAGLIMRGLALHRLGLLIAAHRARLLQQQALVQPA